MFLVEKSDMAAAALSDLILKDAQTNSLCYERGCLIREPLDFLKLSKL